MSDSEERTVEERVARLKKIGEELAVLQEQLSVMRDRYREKLWEFESIIESFDGADVDLGLAKHYLSNAIESMSQYV